MSNLQLILLAAAGLACSGIPGGFSAPRSRWGERSAVAGMSLAALLGLWGVLRPDRGEPATLELAWGLPWGHFTVAVDALSRAFLIPVFLIPALGTVYGLGYWRQSEHVVNAHKLRFFYGLMPAAMTIILVARDGAVFLIAWEVMAVAAYFLMTTEDQDAEARRAGWIYFVATHVGTLSLLAFFAVWRSVTGSFTLQPSAAAMGMPPGAANALFILAAIGFGLKAGLMPLHVWLPGAHANAPSHVSAVLSGVMLKLGIYGIVRMTSLLPLPPAWWGTALVVAGAVSAVLGLVFAASQHDLKRLLAYSSIENLGIITIGLGLALLGRTFDEPLWVALGLGGAVLHVWNHSLFKPLLFFGAGSVLHGAGTRRIDGLGGLGQRMPRTAALFLTGSVAICALPPLNGFASELLLYLGFFQTLGSTSAAWCAAVIPALALVGGLAAVTFAALFGTVFAGDPRSEPARHAHESPGVMLVPMAILAFLCAALGIFPAAAAPLLDQSISAWWTPIDAARCSVANAAPLRWLPFTGFALLAFSGLGFVRLRRTTARDRSDATWGCGYAAPGPRMQYTASSFTQLLRGLFAWALWSRNLLPTITRVFPNTARFESETPDPVLDRAVLPSLRWMTEAVSRVRLLQQGQIQVYVLYVLVTVVVLFLFM